jgi:hypothetical protein
LLEESHQELRKVKEKLIFPPLKCSAPISILLYAFPSFTEVGSLTGSYFIDTLFQLVFCMKFGSANEIGWQEIGSWKMVRLFAFWQ